MQVVLLAAFLLSSPATLWAGMTAPAKFTNPLDPVKNINVFLANVINWLLGIVGALVMLALIWGGIKYIISVGDPKKVDEAKQVITWAIVGLAVILLAFVIVVTVKSLLGA